MSGASSFRLSRVYAQGWKAARDAMAAGRIELSADEAAALNPFTSDVERQQWKQGFRDGSERTISETRVAPRLKTRS